MHRIDNSTAIAVLPTPAAPGVPGYFTGGNPISGTPATIVDQEWLNAQQESPIALMAAAGILPVKGDYTGEKRAVLRVAGGNVTVINASTALTPDHAGVVRVSAAAGNVVLTLPLAGSAGGIPLRFDILRTDSSTNTVTLQRAGADTIEGATTLLVPVGLRLTLVSDGASAWYVASEAAPARSLASNGWVRLPGGLIVQWGNKTTDGGGGTTVTFPITFPSAAWQLSLGSNVTAAVFHTYQGLGLTGFFMQSWNSVTGAPQASQNASFLAFGR